MTLEEKPASPISPDPDAHKGALEGDRPTDEQFGNPNVDEDGLPADAVSIAEDVIGANEDETTG